MKKFSLLLTFALVLALAIPAFAVEDNVKITGEVKTIFEAAGYGDDSAATIELWEDGDAIDEDSTTDPDEFPAEKAFYQEIDFAIAGMVNENITFDLAVDTLVNNFTTVEGPVVNGAVLGDQGESDDLVLDSALLTLSDEVSTLKFGDMADFHAETYFIDEEDLEGMELTTAINGSDVRAFVVSENDDFAATDFYGVTVGRDLGKVNLTAKVYQARSEGESLTNLAVAADLALSNSVTVDGEIVSNDASQGDQGDTLVRANVNAALTDAVTLNAGVETVGEKFATLSTHDLEEAADYSLYTVGADYALNTNNTLGATYTMVTPGDTFGVNAEDKNTIELALDNVNGAFTNTAAVEFTTSDDYTDGHDVTLITLGTEYAMNGVTTLSADLVNKSDDNNGAELSYTYLKAGLDHAFSETVNWSNEVRFITGETAAEKDGEGSTFRTELSVKF
ncbi:hypothetical protein [Orenia marismortui]|uniref:hypothetical protein n=1 Tax=Orenia marismortui TaxID=46469 RepID=UPI00037C3149|nr:hypothetical protein [Orenia marismortui]